MTLHAHRQGLDAGDGQKGVERRHGRAEIAQRHRPRLGGESEVAEILVEAQAVIGGLGLDQGGELARRAPVELARFDDRAAERVAVAGQELGGGVEDEIRAPFEGPAQIGRGQRVVDDQRNAGRVGDLRHRFEIDHHATGIGQAFDEDRLAARR